MESLQATTQPIPGRPGWRVDENGREWYSDSWLDQLSMEEAQVFEEGHRFECIVDESAGLAEEQRP